jgi:hypothetical protein
MEEISVRAYDAMLFAVTRTPTLRNKREGWGTQICSLNGENVAGGL